MFKLIMFKNVKDWNRKVYYNLYRTKQDNHLKKKEKNRKENNVYTWGQQMRNKLRDWPQVKISGTMSTKNSGILSAEADVSSWKPVFQFSLPKKK